MKCCTLCIRRYITTEHGRSGVNMKGTHAWTQQLIRCCRRNIHSRRKLPFTSTNSHSYFAHSIVQVHFAGWINVLKFVYSHVECQLFFSFMCTTSIIYLHKNMLKRSFFTIKVDAASFIFIEE